MTAVARFDLKLDADDKDLLSRAASLMGTTMAGFVRSAAKEKAQTVLEQESRVTLTKRDFLAFNAAIVSGCTNVRKFGGVLSWRGCKTKGPTGPLIFVRRDQFKTAHPGRRWMHLPRTQ